MGMVTSPRTPEAEPSTVLTVTELAEKGMSQRWQSCRVTTDMLAPESKSVFAKIPPALPPCIIKLTPAPAVALRAKCREARRELYSCR